MSTYEFSLPANGSKQLQIMPQRALTLEQLASIDIPSELSGEYGENRARNGVCQIKATTDFAAIWTWLEEFNVSEETFRSYRKEVERFYNWTLFIAKRPLSSLGIEDISRYETFLADPQPRPFWVAEKKEQKRARRGEPNWRPFEKPLPSKGIAHASIVLGAMFNYLRDVNYLSGNPLAARRLKAKKAKAAGPTGKPKGAVQYISLTGLTAMLQTFEDEIASLPEEAWQQRSKLERMLFTVRFLANTGLRRDELAGAVMGDIYSNESRSGRSWFMHVVGKGDVTRDVPLNERARAALSRYLAFYELEERYAGNQAPIFLPLSGKAVEKENLTAQTVYAVIKEALNFASDKLQASAPTDAYLIRRASPHKFRHTFTTIMSQEKNVSTKMLAMILGHSSEETTSIYTHADLNVAFLAVDKAGI